MAEAWLPSSSEVVLVWGERTHLSVKWSSSFPCGIHMPKCSSEPGQMESYCFGRTALIQLSVKSVERVQLTFLGNTKWMKNVVHGKQSYCIFLFKFNWDILGISVLQFSSERNNFCHPPSLFCLQKIWFCWSCSVGFLNFFLKCDDTAYTCLICSMTVCCEMKSPQLLNWRKC